MPDPIIETVDLHRSYRIGRKSIEVLRGINLRVEPGEKVFLCGPSGAGKTTLLYTLAGLERPEQGTVHIDGTDLYALGRRQQARFRNQRIGYVFQNYHLLPELTALENVAVPGAIAGQDRTTDALAALDRVGLADKADAHPTQLSGGQQQRAAIARALAVEPAVLLFDEPTSALDPELTGEVLAVMRQLAADRTTMVVVTHDVEFARQAATEIVFMDAGRVIESGPPSQVISAPKTDRARRFFHPATGPA